MAIHAQALVAEMTEARRSPVAAYLERLRNYATARRLAKRYGPAKIREILTALGEIEGFPPAQILWNANHGDVPLHCFFRTRIEPVFRIVHLDIRPMQVWVRVEYGPAHPKRIIRENIRLQRNASLELELADRITRQVRSGPFKRVSFEIQEGQKSIGERKSGTLSAAFRHCRERLLLLS